MPPKSKKCGNGIFDSLGSAVGGLPDILKSPEMLATSLLATSPLAPITPLVSGYLFGKKLFGGSVFKDVALKKIAEQTGMTPEEIKLGYLMLKEVMGKIKEVHRDYGHYVPILKDRMKDIKIPVPIHSLVSDVEDIPLEMPKADKVALTKEERMARLAALRKKLGRGSPELQEMEGSGILSGLLSEIGLGKKKRAPRKKKGGAFGPMDALSDLKDMASGYVNHETERFINEDVAPIIRSMNPLKSIGLGKKKKPAKGKGIISDLLGVVGLGKKKGRGPKQQPDFDDIFKEQKSEKEKKAVSNAYSAAEARDPVDERNLQKFLRDQEYHQRISDSKKGKGIVSDLLGVVGLGKKKAAPKKKAVPKKGKGIVSDLFNAVGL